LDVIWLLFHKEKGHIIPFIFLSFLEFELWCQN